MTWRGLVFLLACAAAFAQLPRPQAPKPRDDSSPNSKERAVSSASTLAQLDAVVTDLGGRAIRDLTAADFTLEAGDKPQKIESCEFRDNQPLRLAVVLDDVSLKLAHLNDARRAVRAFVNGLRDEDQMAILRTGAGSGALDQLTSDKAALNAAIDRARYNPESETPSADAFTAGALSVARSALDGMRDLPGRKALLVISEGFRDGRGDTSGWEERLATLAHRGSTVIYAVDMAATPDAARLDRGLAGAAKETSGAAFDGDTAKALARIAQDHAGYYLLTYRAEEFPFDYVARLPRVGKITLRTGRKDASVRARNGVMGLGDDVEGRDYAGVERAFDRALDAELINPGVSARVTAMVTMAQNWQLEAVVHLDGRDITFVRGLDGMYRTTIDSSASLYDADGRAVKEAARSFTAQVTEKAFEISRAHGIDYTVVLPIPRAGAYQVRAAVRDSVSGRTGSTRQFVRMPDIRDGGMQMSSVALHGELVKNEDGVDVTKDPEEAGSVRVFHGGHRIVYMYNLYNVAADAEKRSKIEARTEIWRDGVRISGSDPRTIDFPPQENTGRRGVSGIVALSEAMPPGTYMLRVTASDKLAPRSATRWIDFEVRP